MAVVTQVGPAGTDTADARVETGPGLELELMTVPDPVRISPASGEPEKVEIVIVGTRRSSTPLECSRITVRIPDGERSPELALNLQGVTATISLQGWSATLDSQTKRFVFAPPSGYATISVSQGITIQFRGIPVNRQVGSAPITITECSRPQGETTWNEPQTVIEVGKFPPDFYLRNLTADPLQVDNGGSTTLRWEASPNASYRLLYGAADIDVTNRREFPVTNLTSTTVFYLRGRAQIGEGIAERILNTTVAVNRPDIDATRLTVSHRVQLLGGRYVHQEPADGTRYRTPTDGMIILTARRFSGGPDSDFLFYANQDQHRLRSELSPGRTESFLVPADAVLKVQLGTAAMPWNPNINHLFEWYPLGSGDLERL